jgi:hypothetical protein
MAKWVNPDVLDEALHFIAGAVQMVALDHQPTSHEDAASTALAACGMTRSNFRVADGDISGRKLVVDAQPDVAVGKDGTASHIALLGRGGGLLYVTTCPEQKLVAGTLVTVGEWSIEIGAPN